MRKVEEILLDFGMEVLRASYRGEIGAGVPVVHIREVIGKIAATPASEISAMFSRNTVAAVPETKPTKKLPEATSPDPATGKGKVTTE